MGGWLVSQETPSQSVPQRRRSLLIVSEQQAKEGMRSAWVYSGLHLASHVWWLRALLFLSFLKQCAALPASPCYSTSYTYGEFGLLSRLPSPRPSYCEPLNVAERQMPDGKQSGGDNQLDRPALYCVALLRRKTVVRTERLAENGFSFTLPSGVSLRGKGFIQQRW